MYMVASELYFPCIAISVSIVEQQSRGASVNLTIEVLISPIVSFVKFYVGYRENCLHSDKH